MELSLALYVLVGFGAQLIDGAIGMGYGVISTSVLVATGMPPAVASAAVHVTKMPTGIASGLSHWKFGNIDRSEEHTSELQSLMRISYAVFCSKKNTYPHPAITTNPSPIEERPSALPPHIHTPYTFAYH